MLGRFRSAIYGALGTPEGEPGSTGSGSGSSPSVPDLRSRIDSVSNGISSGKKVKYAYQRPIFLQLFSEDEIQVTADHMVSWFLREINDFYFGTKISSNWMTGNSANPSLNPTIQ